MDAIINKDRLKIFHAYGGDIDGIYRLRRKDDENKFGSNLSVIWGEIDSKLQDLEIIENNLASSGYKSKVINELKVLCNKNTFDDLTIKLSLSKEITLIDIIKDYQKTVDKIVKIFKKIFIVEDIIAGYRHYKLYPPIGQIIQAEIYKYVFNDSSLTVNFKDLVVNFDFEECPELRHDGFELSKLKEFIKNQRDKYSKYQNENKIDVEFRELIEQNIIIKAKTKRQSNIYYFKYYLLMKQI